MNTFESLPLDDNEVKALLAEALAQRPDRYGDCAECGREYPCHTRLDAVHRLLVAGVNPKEWRP